MTSQNESPKRVKRVTLTPAEFAQVTGMTVKAVRVAIHNGQVAATPIGNRLYIPITEIRRKFGEDAFNALDFDALLADDADAA